MLKNKYIKTNIGEFIIFPESITHKFMSNGLNVESAGFVSFNTETQLFVCYGESTSLNLKALDTDSNDLNRQFKLL